MDNRRTNKVSFKVCHILVAINGFVIEAVNKDRPIRFPLAIFIDIQIILNLFVFGLIIQFVTLKPALVTNPVNLLPQAASDSH